MALAGRQLSHEWKSCPRRGEKTTPTSTTKAKTHWIWQTPALLAKCGGKGREPALEKSPGLRPISLWLLQQAGWLQELRARPALSPWPGGEGPCREGSPRPPGAGPSSAAARRHTRTCTRPLSAVSRGSPAVRPRHLSMSPSTPWSTDGDGFWQFVLPCSAGAWRGRG